MKKRRPNHARWLERLRSSKLDGVARGVGAFLLIWADSATGRCFPSIRTIAEASGWTSNTVRGALQRLFEAGLIDLPNGWSRGGPRATHTMFVLWDDPEVSDVADAVTSVSGDEAHAGATPHDMRGGPSYRADNPARSEGELVQELTQRTEPPPVPASLIDALVRWKGAALNDDERGVLASAVARTRAVPMPAIVGSDGSHDGLMHCAIVEAIETRKDYRSTPEALALIETICAACIEHRRMPGRTSDGSRATKRPTRRSGNGYGGRETTAERRARKRAGEHPEPTGIDSLPIIPV